MTGFVTIATGRFTMGSDEPLADAATGEGPARMVTVGSFEMASAPVTTAEFAAFVDSTTYTTIAEVEGSGFVRGELVTGAWWREPTGPGSAVALDDRPVAQVCWMDALAYCDWRQVRLPTEAEWEYAAGLGALGDVTNVWEWCADWFDATFHRDEQRVNPTGPISGTKRVLRGNADRVTARHADFPDASADNIGFRVARRSTRYTDR